MQTKKDKRKDAEISISGTLPKERIQKESEKTLAAIAREIELPGFRKGKVPLQKVREYVGEKALWKESAEAALKLEVEGILKEHEVLPIMPVSAALGASEEGLDVSFEIIATVAPTCSIENYKETAAKAVVKVPEFDEVKERESALEALRGQARAMTQSEGTGALSDEEAKKLGFENSTAVEFFLKDESERAVQERELQKRRGAIAEALLAKAACDIPRVIVMEEARNLLEATKKDVARQGLPWNEYLKRTGKTEEQILGELSAPAEKRVSLDIIFAEVARAEKVEYDAKEEDRLAHALVSQGVEHEQAHQYVKATVMREKVWELLGAKAIPRDVQEGTTTELGSELENAVS